MNNLQPRPLQEYPARIFNNNPYINNKGQYNINTNYCIINTFTNKILCDSTLMSLHPWEFQQQSYSITKRIRR